jgi:predicted alpha/beta-fold hydrolase
MNSRSKKLLKDLELPLFKPLPFLKSGMSQTVAAAYWPHPKGPAPDRLHYLRLPDGDQLVLVENRPTTWKLGDRVVVLVHGLTGNHESNYMTRLARKLTLRGYLVLRVNLRGSGIGFGLARLPYHSGRSEDLRQVLYWAASHFPLSAVTQIGFSLGGNITLKLAGEDGDHPSGGLDSVIAVSPPTHLSKTAIHINASKNKVFDQFFVWKLRHLIWKQHRFYPDLERPKFPLKMAMTDIDEYYTAPRSGFSGAQDYYQKSSSAPLIPSISVRGLILGAQDDPIVDVKSYDEITLPEKMDLILTPKGGHVGFMGKTEIKGDYQWMDQLICRWLSHL